MNLKEVCKNIALKELGVPGTMVECMVEGLHYGIKGCFYKVIEAANEHLSLDNVHHSGCDPSKYRKVIS